MSKPSVKNVSNWYIVFKSDKVEVKSAEEGAWYSVRPAGGRIKYFYGERAWSDARRIASDLDTQAWSAI